MRILIPPDIQTIMGTLEGEDLTGISPSCQWAQEWPVIAVW
jgi:hypothetical protein